MAKVVVGLSGGVDSSVAAYLLKQEGHEVIGIFMRNWNDESVTINNECPWIDDSNDALLVAEKLEIPFQTIDFSDIYKDRIVDYMFSEYEAGRTPNPDVLCNREIKFDVFLKTAMGLGADYVATGHYCRKNEVVKDGSTSFQLLAGKDQNKDQSYFLCQLTQDQLAKALFPIGELDKSEVRRIAAELDLVTADKKDSQGLCFIGKVKLPDFLQQQLSTKTGDIVEVSSSYPAFSAYQNLVVSEDESSLEQLTEHFQYEVDPKAVCGQHQGAHFFTLGQRKGLGVGGKTEPLFVIGTDVRTNTIYTGQGENHPGLYHRALKVQHKDVHWIDPANALQYGESIKVSARIRYRQDLQGCKLINHKSGLFVLFDSPQKAITPGQFVAWYDGDVLLGSGVID